MAEVKQMQEKLDVLVNRQQKDYYSTDEFAKLKGLEPKTVRDNLSAGRLKGIKRRDGHGRSQRWAIPHEELQRYEREGLLSPGK